MSFLSSRSVLIYCYWRQHYGWLHTLKWVSHKRLKSIGISWTIGENTMYIAIKIMGWTLANFAVTRCCCCCLWWWWWWWWWWGWRWWWWRCFVIVFDHCLPCHVTNMAFGLDFDRILFFFIARPLIDYVCFLFTIIQIFVPWDGQFLTYLLEKLTYCYGLVTKKQK